MSFYSDLAKELEDKRNAAGKFDLEAAEATRAAFATAANNLGIGKGLEQLPANRDKLSDDERAVPGGGWIDKEGRFRACFRISMSLHSPHYMQLIPCVFREKGAWFFSIDNDRFTLDPAGAAKAIEAALRENLQNMYRCADKP